MSNEIFSRDQNHVTVLGAITNDVAQDVRMLRVDPATGRLIVSAVIAGTNNGQLKVSASDTTYGYLSAKLVAGNNVTLTILNPGANEELEISVNNPGYDEVQENGVAVTGRHILNFKNGFTVTDNIGNLSTDIEIDESELDLSLIGGLLDLTTQVTGQLPAANIDITDLESNLDLANIGGLLDLSTQVTGQLSSTYIDITNLESNLDLANIAGLLDLTTQVTGQLPAANIDVADLITQLNDNVTVAVDGVTITGDGTTGNPLVAVGGGGSAERKVGVGEITDATIFNAQLQFIVELWSAPTNRVTNINFSASQDAVTLAGVFPGVDGGSSAGAFSDSRLFIVEAIVYLNNGNNVGAFGFNPAGDTNAITISNNIEGAYFVGDGSGNLYIQTGTGAARTQTNLGAIAGGREKLRIEFDRTIGTPAARFYRDGVLVGTITTNLPNSSEVGVTFQNGAGDVLIESAGCPSVAMEF